MCVCIFASPKNMGIPITPITLSSPCSSHLSVLQSAIAISGEEDNVYGVCLLTGSLVSFSIASQQQNVQSNSICAPSLYITLSTINTMVGSQGGQNEIAVNDLLLSADCILHGN